MSYRRDTDVSQACYGRYRRDTYMILKCHKHTADMLRHVDMLRLITQAKHCTQLAPTSIILIKFCDIQ